MEVGGRESGKEQEKGRVSMLVVREGATAEWVPGKFFFFFEGKEERGGRSGRGGR